MVEDCKTRLEDDEWADEIADEMVRSKRILLQWLECCMEKYKNQIFIYRPHPVEKLDNNLKLLEKKYANFKYVADFSLKQWIKYADNVIVYYSTSIVDAFYNKKNSYIFRPFDLNPENDSVMMLEADYITSYEEFEEIFKNHDNWRYPIKIETVEDYYGKWNDGKAYYRIADICEKVYNEDIYYITLPLKGKSVIDWLKNIIFKIVLEINCFVPISKLVPKKHQFEFCIEYNQMKKYRVQRKIVHKFFDGK